MFGKALFIMSTQCSLINTFPIRCKRLDSKTMISTLHFLGSINDDSMTYKVAFGSVLTQWILLVLNITVFFCTQGFLAVMTWQIQVFISFDD